jgi:predicted DNA binding CopG/RHH family protein
MTTPDNASSTSHTSDASDASRVLSLRIDDELLERIEAYASRRGLTVQDYVIRILAREDFDERFRSATVETARLAEWGPPSG